MKKRFLALLLSGAMIFSTLAVPDLTVYAAEEDGTVVAEGEESAPAAVSEEDPEVTAEEPDTTEVSGDPGEETPTENPAEGTSEEAADPEEETEEAGAEETAAEGATEAATESATEAVTEGLTIDTLETEAVESVSVNLHNADGYTQGGKEISFTNTDETTYFTYDEESGTCSVNQDGLALITSDYVKKGAFTSQVANGGDVKITYYTDSSLTQEITDSASLTESSESGVYDLYVKLTATIPMEFDLGEQYDDELSLPEGFTPESVKDDPDKAIGYGFAYLDKAELTKKGISIDSYEVTTEADSTGETIYHAIYTLLMPTTGSYEFPKAYGSGRDLRYWYNDTKSAKIDGEFQPSGLTGGNRWNFVYAVWKSSDTIELSFNADEQGYAAFSSNVSAKFTKAADGTKSSIKGNKSKYIDGTLSIEEGGEIGTAFYSTKINPKMDDISILLAPSIDPRLAETESNALFTGWEISSEPNAVYTSDELLKYVPSGEVLVEATWDDVDVSKITFHTDDVSSYLVDVNARDYTYGQSDPSQLVRYAKQETDNSARFNVVPYYKGTDEDVEFMGWSETPYDPLSKDTRKATDWVFSDDEDTIDLYPIWSDQNKILSVTISAKNVNTGKDVAITSAKDGSGKSITIMAGEGDGYITLTATVKVKDNVTGVSKDVEWSFQQKFGDNGAWQDVGQGTSADNVVHYYDSKVNDSSITIIAQHEGTARVMVRTVNGGQTDILTIYVKKNLSSLAYDSDETGVTVVKGNMADTEDASSSGITASENYIYLKVKPESIENGRLYFTTTNGTDDFFKIQNVTDKNTDYWEPLTYTVQGSSAIHKYFQIDTTTGTTGKDTVKDGYIHIKLKITANDGSNDALVDDSGERTRAHAGKTTITFYTDTTKDKSVTETVVVYGFDDGDQRYYTTNGSILKNAWKYDLGELKYDYYFDANGVPKHEGIVNANGTYYLISDGSVIRDDKVDTDPVANGSLVYADKKNGYKIQRVQYKGDWYCVDTTAKLLSGWQTNPMKGTEIWYFDAQNQYKEVENDWVVLLSKRYYVKNFVRMQSTEAEIDGDNYLFGSDGAMLTGWYAIGKSGTDTVIKAYGDTKTSLSNAKYYYYDPNTGIRKDSGVVIDGGKRYYIVADKGRFLPKSTDSAFSEKGTGITPGEWLTVDLDGDGKKETYFAGWYSDAHTNALDGALYTDKLLTIYKPGSTETGLYYFQSNGAMLTNAWKTIGGKNYYFNDEGVSVPLTGYTELSSGRPVRFDKDQHVWVYADVVSKTLKKVSTGWIRYEDEDEKTAGNKTKFYYVTLGKIKTGFLTVKKPDIEDGTKCTFYLAEDGLMVTSNNAGVLENLPSAAAQSLTASDGEAVESGALVEISGKYYFVNADGVIRKSTWVKTDDGVYYVGTANNGAALTGRQTITNSTTKAKGVYFFDAASSKMLTGIVKVGTAMYFLSETDGHLVTPAKGESPWQESTKGVIYLNTNGTLKTGFATLAGSIADPSDKTKSLYYFDTNGILYDGSENQIMTLDDLSMYYVVDGKIQKGWARVSTGSSWKYMYFGGKNNAAVTGTQRQKAPDVEESESYPAIGTVEPVSFLAGAKTVALYFDAVGVLYRNTKILTAAKKWVELDEYGMTVTQSTEGIRSAEDGNKYYVTKNGSLKKGIVKFKDGTSMCFDPTTGALVRNSLVRIGGKWYYADRSGFVQTTLRAEYVLISEEANADAETGTILVTFDKTTGAIKKMQTEDGKTLQYALVNLKVNGKVDKSTTYVIGNTGVPIVGFNKYVDGNSVKHIYYTDSCGRIVMSKNTGKTPESIADAVLNGSLLLYNKKYYYQDRDGVRAATTGCTKISIGDTDYYVDINGAVITSAYGVYNGTNYYFDSEGQKANGWYRISNVWHCFKNGAAWGGLQEMELTKDLPGSASFTASTTTNFTGVLSGKWTDNKGNALSGIYYTRTEDEETGVVTRKYYNFTSGAMKVGKAKIYNEASHSYITVTFDNVTGAYTVEE